LHEKHRDELIKSAQEALGELEKKKSVWTRRSLAALLFASVSALIATFAHFALDPVMTKIAIPEEISQSLISQTVASEGKRVTMSDTEAGMDLVLALLDSPAVKALPLIIVTMGIFTGIARQSVFAVIIPIAAG